MNNVPCALFYGPLDGLIFKTPSIYTVLYVRLNIIEETEDGMSYTCQFGPNEFPGSVRYEFEEISDSGYHIYTPA
jgi:hypothetical protein